MVVIAVVALATLGTTADSATSRADATRPAGGGGAVVSIPAPVGLEKKLIEDGRDGKLDTVGLLEGALIASGVADADVGAEAARVRRALAPAVKKAKAQAAAHKRGEVLLKALHETVFRTYATTATEIDDVARTGEFNCLSSSLLYVVAADGLLDAPRAMVTKHHAFARVTVDGKSADVETTTPGGFDSDRTKPMSPETLRQIAGPLTSAQEMIEELKRPEELPVLSLVAGVYSNRAVGLMQRGDLPGAAVALDRALRLASGTLRARAAAWRGGVLNKGAVELVEQGRFDDARALLELALEGTDGETARLLTQNLATVLVKLADKALDDKDWTGALAHAAAAKRLGVNNGDPKHGVAAVDYTGAIEAQANAALATLEGSDARCAKTTPARDASECFSGLARSHRETDVDKALQYGRRAYALDATAQNAERSLFFTLLAKAKAEASAHRCDAVEALIREALPHMGALDGQKWSAQVEMGSCWAKNGDVAFDQKKWGDASRLYGRALAHLPKDDALRGNLARVDFNESIEVARNGDCDRARTLARRAEKVDRALGEKSSQILESCASVRAKRAADGKDYATAAAELRRGLIDAPKSEPLRINLGTMLHNLAVQMLHAKDCDGARALVPELGEFKKDDAKAAVLQQCRT